MSDQTTTTTEPTSPMTRKRRPPISCTPCRVTYEGVRYQIEANGQVRKVPGSFTAYEILGPVLPEAEAKLVRREASRQRRNRNRREADAAKRDMGLVRAKGGAFGGWE